MKVIKIPGVVAYTQTYLLRNGVPITLSDGEVSDELPEELARGLVEDYQSFVTLHKEQSDGN